MKKVLTNSNSSSDDESSEPAIIMLKDDDSMVVDSAFLDVLPMFIVKEDLENLGCDDRYGSHVYDSHSKSSFKIHPKLAHQAALKNLKRATIALEKAIAAVDEAKRMEEGVRSGTQSLHFKRMVVDGIANISTEQVIVTLYTKKSDEQPLLTYHLSNWTPIITLKEDD
jgi:hypothetical protein